MNNFISLAQSLQPALFRIPLLGDTQCWDSYGRATTIGVVFLQPVWMENAKGFSFRTATGRVGIDITGGINVADSGAAPELRVTAGTVLVFSPRFDFTIIENGSRLYSKRDAGGTNFELFKTGVANQLGMFDGTVTSNMTHASLTGARSVGVRFTPGVVPSLFTDGVYRVAGTLAVTPPANDADLCMCNIGPWLNYTFGSNVNSYSCVLLFNDAILGRPITDQEISQLHDAWESIISIKAPKRTISLPVQTSEVVSATPLVHLAGPRTPTGLWPDISGNGRDGTISGRVTQTKGPKGVVQQGHGTGNPLIITAADAALNPSSITAHLAFKRNGRGEANSGVYFAINNNLVMCMELWDLNATTLCIGETYADGEKYWTFPVPNVALKPTLDIVLRYNRDLPATLAYVLVDGEAVTVTDFNVKVGARVANPAPRVSVLGRGDLLLDADGAVSDVQVYGSLLSDAECRALYVAQALLNEQRLANRTDYPISVAAVTAAGNVGPWNWLGQSFNWSDNGTGRILLSNQVNARADCPASQVYGAWYWRQKATTTLSSTFMPIASIRGSWGGAMQNGYMFDMEGAVGSLRLYLMRIANGISVAWILTSAAGAVAHNVDYEFFLTRRPRDGMFTVYIRGGAYATWTVVGVPAVDATYTTSVAVNTNLQVNDYIADVTMLPDGSGLVPTDIPWLV